MSMSVIATLVSLLCSGMALAFLNHTDAKRRRTYKLPAYEKSHKRKWVWLVVFLPLIFLIAFNQWTALVMWATALSLVGWALAVKKPVTTIKHHDETI